MVGCTNMPKLNIPVPSLNKVVRIVCLYKQKIWLCGRWGKNDHEAGKVDIPCEAEMRLRETIDKCIGRAFSRVHGADLKSLRFCMKYMYERMGERRLVYLFLINADKEPDVTACTGKPWTIGQIESNLGLNYFSDYFEYEFPHLRMLVDVWKKYGGG